MKFDTEGSVLRFNVIKGESGQHGHIRVPLKYLPGKERKYLVHRLVYQAFIGELDNTKVINHIDGNPKNNHVSNLEQVTQKENIHHAIKIGTFIPGNTRPIFVVDRELNKGFRFESVKEFFDCYGIKSYNGSLSSLKKYKRYKDRFIIAKLKKSTD